MIDIAGGLGWTGGLLLIPLIILGIIAISYLVALDDLPDEDEATAKELTQMVVYRKRAKFFLSIVVWLGVAVLFIFIIAVWLGILQGGMVVS
jgi:hypothetical protein